MTLSSQNNKCCLRPRGASGWTGGGLGTDIAIAAIEPLGGHLHGLSVMRRWIKNIQNGHKYRDQYDEAKQSDPDSPGDSDWLVVVSLLAVHAPDSTSLGGLS